MSLPSLEGRYIPEPNSGCWLWTGAATAAGYGVVSKGPRGRQKTYLTHRVAFESVNGAIPAGLFVCHRCDVPSCVNPDHLFLGTARDNTRDMLRKGRDAFGINSNPLRGEAWGVAHEGTLPVGESHHSAKLSEETVRFVRSSRLSGNELARMFNVAPITLSRARRGVTWRCVKD